MNNKITHIVLLAFIVTQVVLGIYLYPYFPDQVATHWNAQGEVDGHMSKFWGVSLISIIMIVFYALYVVIPRIDPRAQNIAEFRKTFNLFWVGLFVFFFYISALSNAWNLGAQFDFTQAMIPAMGMLFYFIGNLLLSTKRNSFMGIRTPWTMASDVVWDKTHKLGGGLFKLSGILTLGAGLIGGTLAFATLITCVVLSTVISIVYSYKVFKKLALSNTTTSETSK
ncbi:MAG: SdpI family protein [Candidatus Pacebacteria bacterium]|jgi:uncharacterized membrane protein|nr:SdpI family protein [Candidatus Paceibacterota bacterium]MBP9851287.1 SdpI family protein [Candidatus Paceibacterota bacterium]